MSSSSAGGLVSFLGEVIGSLFGMGVCGVPIVPSPLAHPSRVPCLGIVLSRIVSSLKVVKDHIAHLISWTHLAKRHGWPGFGRLALLAQYCRACAYALAVLLCSPGRGSLDPGSVEMPSGWCTLGWVVMSSHFQLVGLCSLPMGPQRKLLFSGLASGSHLHQGYHQLTQLLSHAQLAPSPFYQDFTVFHWGLLPEVFLCLWCSSQLPQKMFYIGFQGWWGP